MSARGFLGAGNIFLARYDTGLQAYLPPAGPYEATKFAIKATTRLEEMTGRGKATYGQILASVAIPEPTEIELEIAEVNREALAMALLGTVATLAQSAGATTDEVVTAPNPLGGWIKLAKHSLAEGSVVVTNSAASTTYVLDTDYEVNHALGWIRPIPEGAIVAAQSLKVDYTATLVAGSRIRGVTNAQVRAQLMFDGINQVDGSACQVECYEAVFSSSAAFDFLSSGFASVPLTGRLATPVGKTEPFQILLPTG